MKGRVRSRDGGYNQHVYSSQDQVTFISNICLNTLIRMSDYSELDLMRIWAKSSGIRAKSGFNGKLGGISHPTLRDHAIYFWPNI